MTLDLNHLLGIAGKATPGPWTVADPPTVVVSQAPWPDDEGPGWHEWDWAAGAQSGHFVAEGATNEAEGRANAAHIATFDPPTVTALILRAQAAERALEKIKAGGFNCAPHQWFMAAQGIAEEALASFTPMEGMGKIEEGDA